MMEWPKFTNPYIGIKPPPGVHVPEREELLSSICTKDEPRKGFPYPPEAPTFWIKYGDAVYWNEVCAQSVAYDGLRQIESSVRAPGVYYAFQEGRVTYIVMEYIPGKTALQLLKEAHDEAEKEVILQSIASAVSELHRIPIPESRLRPAAISGGRFRHSIFGNDYDSAPLHYESAQHFEDNANAYLKLAFVGDTRIRDLAREPMVFCQADLYPGNFIIDADNRVTAIDLERTSIVPSSFAKLAVSDYVHGYGGVDISPWVYFPVTEGVDNTNALLRLRGRLSPGPEDFVEIGLELPGAEETQKRIKSTLQGQLIDEHVFVREPTVGEIIAEWEANGRVGERPFPDIKIVDYVNDPPPLSREYELYLSGRVNT
ncbi:hypothetical protein V494_02351 [Pseudogymnoascus sp. VKM F-4513 (FW-928)]|nr:hypothetical protein V494_02351 [Pseudogymnoascus sp. VKM F-4513 (FW-928)]